MNKLMHHHLGFNSDCEKEVFENVLSVINSVNNAFGSFDIYVGASLISRLILLLHSDSAQPHDDTHPSLMEDLIEENRMKSRLIREVSVSQQERPAEVNRKACVGVDTICKVGLDSCASSRERKKIFKLIPYENNGASFNVNGLATKLAKIISEQVLAENSKSASIADIVCQCINMINNVKTGNKVLRSLSYIILKGGKGEEIWDSFAAQEELQQILTIALNAVLQDIRLSVEAVHDFEYAWEACAHRSPRLSNIFAEDQAIGAIAKDFAWTLASTIFFHRNLIKSLTTTDQALTECKRRERITLSAASIDLISRSTVMNSLKLDTGKEPSIKRKCLDHGMSMTDNMNGCDKDKRKGRDKSKNTNQPRSRVSLENDAIAALSMMITGNVSNSVIEPNKKISESESSDLLMQSRSNDVVNILIQSSNEILSLIKTTEKTPPSPIDREDLENESQIVDTHFTKLQLMMETYENDCVAAGMSVQTIPGGKLNSPKNNLTHTGWTIKQGDIENFGGDKRKSTERESCISCLSTHDSLSSTKVGLRLLYQRLTNLPHERHPLQDIFSYFGKCKFVDDIDISSQSSSNLRQTLIESHALGTLQGCVTAIDTGVKVKIYDRLITHLPQTGVNNKSRNIQNSAARSLHASKPSTIIASKESTPGRTGSSASHFQLPQDDVIVQSVGVSDWANKLFESAMKSIQPSLNLNMYLEAISDCEMIKISTPKGWKGVIIPTLNNALYRIWKSRVKMPGSRNFACAQENNNLVKVNEDDLVKVNEDGILLPKNTASLKFSSYSQHTEITHEIIGRALVKFFYSALEAILYHETARIKSTSHPKLVMSPSFQNALLSVCYTCLLSTIGEFSKLGDDINEDACGSLLNVRSLLDLMDCSAYEYLKISETFIHAMVSKHSSQGLPLFLVATLRETEICILEVLLWAQHNQTLESSHLVGVIQKLTIAGRQGAQYQWPPGILQSSVSRDGENKRRKKKILSSGLAGIGELGSEYTYVTFLMKRTLEISSQRIATICVSLMIPPTYPIASQIWIAFRELLRNHIHLLYNRHIDQLILCTIFGICRMIKPVPEITFAKILEVYRDLNRNSERIISHVPLKIANEECQTAGNIIHLYNQVYIPEMKQYLLHNKSLKAAAMELKRCIAEGKQSLSVKTSFHQQVNGTNIFLKCPTRSHESHGKRGKLCKWDHLEPKTRVLYNFSRGSGKVVTLINETVCSTSRTHPIIKNITP